MTPPLLDHSPQDLLAFYERVKPILSEWLAKPVWTARETALLCAGYIPHDTPGCEKFVTSDQQGLLQNVVPIDPYTSPIDPCRYVPPNHELHSDYLRRLSGKEAGPPRDMVQLLSPTSKKTSIRQVGQGQCAPVSMPRPFHLEALGELRWFFIIGNAVGLPVPTFVPFGLLDELSVRLTIQAKSASVSSQVQVQSKSVVPGLISEEKPKAGSRKVRERKPIQTTPEKRGYHTTEEVAGLTNLLPDTLNKYAREGIPVEGFTAFKRQNGRPWQWRDDQQQAEYEANNSAGKVKNRPK